VPKELAADTRFKRWRPTGHAPKLLTTRQRSCPMEQLDRLIQWERHYSKGVIMKGPAQQRGAIKEVPFLYRLYKIAHLYQKIPGSHMKAPPRKDLQKEILPQWQSALKWGLREVQPGSTPSCHTAELPSPVLPGLTGSFPQVLNQWFRPWLSSYHTSGFQ